MDWLFEFNIKLFLKLGDFIMDDDRLPKLAK
jgi:hypothetical protein